MEITKVWLLGGRMLVQCIWCLPCIHTAALGSSFGISHDQPNLPRVIPKHRVQDNPWAPPSMVKKIYLSVDLT